MVIISKIIVTELDISKISGPQSLYNLSLDILEISSYFLELKTTSTCIERKLTSRQQVVMIYLSYLWSLFAINQKTL